MVAALDQGPIVSRAAAEIESSATAGELKERLTTIACALLDKFFENPTAALRGARTQSNKGIRYAHKLKKQERAIDWRGNSAVEIARKVNAFNPKQMAQTFLDPEKTSASNTQTFYLYYPKENGERAKPINILRAGAVKKETQENPGRLIASGKKLFVTCREGMLDIHELQLPSKKAMKSADFINGYFNARFPLLNLAKQPLFLHLPDQESIELSAVYLKAKRNKSDNQNQPKEIELECQCKSSWRKEELEKLCDFRVYGDRKKEVEILFCEKKKETANAKPSSIAAEQSPNYAKNFSFPVMNAKGYLIEDNKVKTFGELLALGWKRYLQSHKLI